MATTIQIKRSTGGSAPTTGQLADGELAYAQDQSNDGANSILYIESVDSGTAAVIHKVGGKYYTDIIEGANTAPAGDSLVKRYANGDVQANTFIGSLEGFVDGTANAATQLVTPRSITLIGDVTANTAVFDGTAGVTLNTTFGDIALGTDTSGDYVSNITASTGIDISGEGGEASNITVSIEDTAVTAGSYGGTDAIPTFIVDQQGRLTFAGNNSISTDLNVSGDTGSDTVSLASENLHFTGTAPGAHVSVASNTVTVVNTGVTNIANTNGEITADVSTGNVTLGLPNSGVTAGDYGNAIIVPRIVVDSKGRITSVSNSEIGFDAVPGNLVPDVNVTYDLGSHSKRWRDAYLSGGTLVLGNVALKDNNGELAVQSVDPNTGQVTGSIEDTASNSYVNTRVDTKANITDLTLEVSGNAGSTSTTDLYTDTLDIHGGDSGIHTSVADDSVAIFNTGVTSVTSGGHGLVTDAATGNLTLTFTGVGNVLGTANEINVNQNTGNVIIGLPDDITIGRDLTVSGNLVVNGTAITVNSETLQIEDPLLHLGNVDATTDVLDIGFVGHYYDTSLASERHAGLFRDASDSGKFKLFANLDHDPHGENTVDTTDPSFTLAVLETNIAAGNVSGLFNPIVVSDGGTGRSTLTANAVMYGDGTNQIGLASGAAGQVLQLNDDGLVVFAGLDGGTF